MGKIKKVSYVTYNFLILIQRKFKPVMSIILSLQHPFNIRTIGVDPSFCPCLDVFRYTLKKIINN